MLPSQFKYYVIERRNTFIFKQIYNFTSQYKGQIKSQ